MRIGEIEKKCLRLLRLSIIDDKQESVDISLEEFPTVLAELRSQTVAALVSPGILVRSGIPDNLIDELRGLRLRQVGNYTRYVSEEENVINKFRKQGVPLLILKGTSASCYYPNPELRSMGDIDIFTKTEDIEKACSIVEELGYELDISDHEFGRTIKYIKDNREIEVHKYYASLNEVEKAEYFDNLLLDNIQGDSVRLPDDINGLVLLEHISDHLEHGLGLRQIIDWLFYVQNYLDDKAWEDGFKQYSKKIGLETLAVTVTRMCQIYLGLGEEITWCSKANEKLCDELMYYIMASGNFGRKEGKDEEKSDTIAAFTTHSNPVEILKILQKYGKVNWKLLEKYDFLTPFAWIYQIGRSVNKRMKSNTSVSEVYKEYQESQVRKKMFDELGVKQHTKGLAIRKGDHFEIVEYQDLKGFRTED